MAHCKTCTCDKLPKIKHIPSAYWPYGREDGCIMVVSFCSTARLNYGIVTSDSFATELKDVTCRRCVISLQRRKRDWPDIYAEYDIKSDGEAMKLLAK